MDFQIAKEFGYYFDRCIDLTFYDTSMNFLAKLNTPSRGMKPTITIKGIFIEGGYAIDSYISVQNMAFDIDVASIGYIKANMYYSGLKESIASTLDRVVVNSGNTILYKVLYADQEKEPPNRCVRFQCVVASKDISMYETKVLVTGGTLRYISTGFDVLSSASVISNKSNSKVSLKTLCIELITAYNNGIKKNTEAGKSKEYYDLMKISLLEIDEPLETLDIELSPGEYQLGDFVRFLNSNITETDTNGFSYPKFKIVIDRGSMRVSTPVPKDWKSIAKSKGYPANRYEEFYQKEYASVKTNSYTILGNAPVPEKETLCVPLNFVKNATRSECVVYIETLFDSRITPGCEVSIKSNAIMGKKFGSSKSTRGGSRILNYLDKEEPIKIRNTGKIEYLFSTTEDSYMKLQGPVKESAQAISFIKQAKSERDELLSKEKKQ